jgi:hypothetical protein
MSTNPNVVILNKAWGQLWNSTTPYYLPKILADGGTFGKTVIPPMKTVDVPPISPIPLYSSDIWGNVTITLSSVTLAGLPSIKSQSFTPSSDATSVAAVVAFDRLEFAGSYTVEGTGLVGCAMTLGQAFAYRGASATGADDEGDEAGQAGQPIPPEQMDLARQYRDHLVNSPNGTSMVASYYDNNDTINWILNQENAFTEAWPYNAPTNPPDRDTAYYMQVTANSAANPDDPNYTVGGNNTGYQSHGGYMQGMLIGTCHYYANTDPAKADACRALASDTATFRGYTNKYPNPMTSGAVMSAVDNTQPMSAEELAAIPEPEGVRLGREAAERDFDELHNRAMAKRAARLAQGTTYQSTGKFGFGFAMPTLTFSGTVAISGIPPQQVLTVTLNSLSAAIPNVAIDLLTGSDPNFTADARDKIRDAGWFQQVLGTKVNAELGSASVRDYLSNVLNQAILGVLG